VRVAIFAPFSSFADSYSLAHVVSQQARCLRRRGHDVEVWTLANLDPTAPMVADLKDIIRPCVAVTIWEKDKTKPDAAAAIADDLSESIQRFKPEAIITHDAVFQAWYIDAARAVHELAETPIGRGCRWYHTAHSVIDGQAPPPVGDERYRRTLPDGHSIIFPNRSTREAVARYYATTVDRVHPCANVHDPRALWPVHPLAEEVIDRADLLSREIVQVYPFCATRAAGKNVGVLLKVFRAMQQEGIDALPVLCESSADTRDGMAAMDAAIAGAEGVECFRTSSLDACRKMFPHRAVMDLMRLSNLFCFPTVGEACPLIMIEAMAAGCVIAVNEAVPSLVEYAPENAVRFRLGGVGGVTSYRATVTHREPDGSERVEQFTGEPAFDIVIRQIAQRCAAAVKACPSASGKAKANRLFSYDAVGRRLEEIISGR
jgi:hypothetical protein